MPLRLSCFVSLRTRFMGLALLLTLLFSATWGAWTWERERQLLYDRLSREGKLLVSTMAIPIISALLYEELGIVKEGGLLDNFVTDIMANDQLHPLYAMVLDQNGRVLAHNRFSEYGRLNGDEATRAALTADGFRQTDVAFEGAAALDMAMPLAIAGKRWGCLRVGVSLAPLRAELRDLAGHILLFSAAFSIGAMILFAFVGNGLARPLKALSGQMEQVNSGALEGLPPSSRRDEIGLLQTNFSQMLDRLNRSEVEREASFQRMLENERLATVGRIVSGVAHEVNNPLAGIQGALYHIGQKGGADVGRYTAVAQQGLERIGKIVHQLLDLSRAGSVELEPVDSRALFEELALFAGMALKPRRVRLDARDLCPPRLLQLDRDKVHQVILNLLLNAADAVGEGGAVELSAYLFEGSYCLRVRDEGPGIPAEILDRIFDPFFTTKEPGKGSGMGLAISRSIAESHGGTLAVQSSPATGTAFILRLPLLPDTGGPDGA